jgi:hypothetical protein
LTSSRTGRWLAAAAWTVLLFAISSDLFSSAHTGGLLHLLLGDLLSPAAFDLVHAALRKLGHLTGYAIAALLYYRALDAPVAGNELRVAEAPSAERDESDVRNAVPPQPVTRDPRLAASLVALLLVLVVASLDELHQSTIPSRTGTPIDVLIDLTGGVIAQLLLRVEWRRGANC